MSLFVKSSFVLVASAAALLAQTPPVTSGEGKNREETIRAARERNNLGVQYPQQGRYAEAEPLLAQAAELYQSTSGDTDAALATTLNNLGASYAGLGRFADAETTYLREDTGPVTDRARGSGLEARQRRHAGAPRKQSIVLSC